VKDCNPVRTPRHGRPGYFVRDPDSTPDHPVFNRTIGLRDSFAKEVGAKG
jgi:glutaminyl-tRNA synthetase